MTDPSKGVRPTSITARRRVGDTAIFGIVPKRRRKWPDFEDGARVLAEAMLELTERLKEGREPASTDG
jgi:hypothetical protein